MPRFAGPLFAVPHRYAERRFGAFLA
jgi:hypothetical protein